LHSSTPAIPTLRQTIEAGLRGARENLAPGLALQIGALGLVLAYYNHSPTREMVGRLAEWRTEVGMVYSVVSTAVFGGLLPLLYLWASPASRGRYTAVQGAALVAFWGYKGIEIELWFRFMAFCFGDGVDARTILFKALVDQLVWSPAFAVIVTALAYEWIGSGFDVRAVWRDVRAGAWYRRRVMAVLISSLGVWAPTCAIIFAMPTPLQLPLQNLVLCFYTLLVAQLTRRVAG
jgi:hypothetical protein